jgi:hypothetical protein
MKRAADDQGDGSRRSPARREPPPEHQDGSTTNPPPPDQDANGTADDGPAAVAAAEAASSPVALVCEEVPDDLFPVGRLVSSPSCVQDLVNNEPSLQITLDTFLTDICSIPEWYLVTKADDTEANPRRPVLLGVTPTDMEGATFDPRDMAMDQESNLRMTKVTVCPITICEHAPRWLFDGLSSLYSDRGVVDMNHFLPDDATVYVRLGAVTRIRSWTPAFPGSEAVA